MIRHALAFFLFLGVPAQLAAQDIPQHGNRTKIEMVKKFELRGDARAAFRQFKRKSDYFGTIYINRPERHAGVHSNANSPWLSDAYAQALCHKKSRNPDYCVLYARSLPKNYDPTRFGVTLSHAGNKEFREYRKLQNKKRSGAFAIADNGATGYSWAEASPQMAQQEALRRCAKASSEVLREAPEDLRSLLSSPVRQACRVVHRSN
ncbi:hypothetical protein [uncultured Shimia sp.]|uniref:hypothetical protein n=1 Tax=uncultured Shimia sp. TaxID=573152 RepID=UPI0025FDB677|nr:hypothetical protein [uncultured Shimia sp.]